MSKFLNVPDFGEAGDWDVEWEIIGVPESKILSVEDDESVIVKHARDTLLLCGDVG